MKIVLLAPASSIHTVRWVNAISKSGNEVHLLSLKNHREGVNKIDRKVRVYYLPFRGMPGYYLNAFSVKRICSRIKPDIINTHYASGYGTLSRLSGIGPVLLSVWGADVYDFPRSGWLKRRILKKNLRAAAAVASTSRIMARETAQYLKPGTRIFVTPFGVDMKKFHPVKKTGRGKFVIGTVKALEEKYGIRYMIEAASLLISRLRADGHKKAAQNVRLVIYGKGSLLKELKELASSAGLSRLTKFGGFIPNNIVPAVIAAMDVFCVPSVWDSESFGVSAVEAMACAVPVLASDTPGLKEVMQNRKTGYILPKGKAGLIADRLYELFLDAGKRRRMGTAGVSRVKQLYNWDDNVRNMLNIYKKVISANPV